MAITYHGTLAIDDNDKPVMGGVSSVDDLTIINSAYDPTTRRLLVDESGTGGGGAPIYSETPGGLINGVNKTYTTANTITTVLNLYYNGEEIHPAEYTVTGAGLTFNTALPVISGAAFTIVYQSGSSSGGFTTLTPTGAVNSSNTVFTFTSTPTYILADGLILPRLDNNGNAMWTIAGMIVTMINPPSYILLGI